MDLHARVYVYISPMLRSRIMPPTYTYPQEKAKRDAMNKEEKAAAAEIKKQEDAEKKKVRGIT